MSPQSDNTTAEVKQPGKLLPVLILTGSALSLVSLLVLGFLFLRHFDLIPANFGQITPPVTTNVTPVEGTPTATPLPVTTVVLTDPWQTLGTLDFQFSYPQNLPITSKQEASGAFKKITFSYKGSELSIDTGYGYLSGVDDVYLASASGKTTLDEQNFRFLLKSDSQYNYYMAGQEYNYSPDYTCAAQKMKVPCYEQVFYTTNGSWKVAYKILKADTTEDLQVFDDIVRSVEISAYDITLKYKGGMEFKDFLGDPDQNTWMGLVPGDPEFVYTLDPEVAPENYLESAPFLMSKDLLGSYFDAGKLIVGSSYEIKGKLDTVIEGGPPTYKFYILTGFKKV